MKIIQNKQIAKDTFDMLLSADTNSIQKPGQFINISIDGQFLRRPISICDYNANSLRIIYKLVGYGTKWLSTLNKDDCINALLPLGNGFDVNPKYQLLVGGGVGIPPLFNLCKQLVNLDIKPKVVLGFLSKQDAFLVDQFNKLADVYVCTDDGSLGLKGLVTDVVKKYKFENIPYACCGPLAMEKALYNLSKTYGQISLEARMGCGFGACMGCSINTKLGPKRICKDGPVFKTEDLLW